jgi:hypothetical protein
MEKLFKTALLMCSAFKNKGLNAICFVLYDKQALTKMKLGLDKLHTVVLTYYTCSRPFNAI